MKKFFRIVSNLLVYLLICIIIFSAWESFKGLYNIKYNDFSKNAIHDFILENNIKLKNSRHITNVTMQQIIPSGYAYTIYYIDVNNKKQSEKISRKSETIFKDYMIANSENLGKKYNYVCKIAFYVLICIILLKGFVTRIHNKK